MKSALKHKHTTRVTSGNSDLLPSHSFTSSIALSEKASISTNKDATLQIDIKEISVKGTVKKFTVISLLPGVLPDLKDTDWCINRAASKQKAFKQIQTVNAKIL